jgi:hypothetical protein
MQLTLHSFSANWRDRGIVMNGFARSLGTWLLLAAAAGLAACSSGASGLITGSTQVADTDAPGGFTNENPLARPIGVAWTSARAKRCGFYFDPAKLRSSYLAYEARQSNGELLAKSEKSYDTTYQVITQRISADPNYCTDRKGVEIKTELARYLKGDYAPNFPKAKVVASCGFFGCGPEASDEKFESKSFWDANDKKNIK